jgi:polysaccharide export outer membrane protein
MKVVLAALFLVYLVTWGVRGDDLQHRARYTLRVGDVLNVEYTYTPELNQTVTVSPDGYVSLNLVGDVKVGELTVEEAHEKIVEKASERLNNPELNLVLEQFQPPYVVVAGEVGKPGQINFSAESQERQQDCGPRARRAASAGGHAVRPAKQGRKHRKIRQSVQRGDICEPAARRQVA